MAYLYITMHHKIVVGIVIVGAVIAIDAFFWGGIPSVFESGNRASAPLPTTPTETGEDNANPRNAAQTLTAVRDYVSTHTGVDENEVIVPSLFEKEWPNGCLGLEQTGEFCTQVITPGFEVTAEVGGETIVYRTNADGSVIREAQ